MRDDSWKITATLASLAFVFAIFSRFAHAISLGYWQWALVQDSFMGWPYTHILTIVGIYIAIVTAVFYTFQPSWQICFGLLFPPASIAGVALLWPKEYIVQLATDFPWGSVLFVLSMLAVFISANVLIVSLAFQGAHERKAYAPK